MAEIKSYTVTKRELINTPVVEQTRTYRPVSHEQLMDITLESIHQAGFSLDKEYYSGCRNNQVANGKYTITNVADRDMQIQIGWQNSYNRQISLKFALGVHIFICGNGCVSGDMGAFKRKHQGDVQEFTPKYITEYIKTAGDVFVQMQTERDVLKNIEIDRHIAAQLVGQMYLENQIIESTQMNIIKREFDSPTFDYNASNSMWELMQFTTYSLKQVHPTLWLDSHVNVHKFFMEQAGIVTPVTNIIIPEPESPFVQLELFDTLFTTSV